MGLKRRHRCLLFARQQQIIDFAVFGKHHLNLLVILNEGKRRVRREEGQCVALDGVA